QLVFHGITLSRLRRSEFAKPQAALLAGPHVARHAKAGPAIGLALLEPKTAGRTAAPAFVQPAPAADHHEEITPKAGRPHAVLRPLRIFLGTLLVGIRVVPVIAPLQDVAVHVVQAPGVRRVRAD